MLSLYFFIIVYSCLCFYPLLYFLTCSDIVNVLCNITGIPHLQFDWHGEETDMVLSNYMYTTNVAPSVHVLSQALLDIVKNEPLNWKSFTIAYETSSGKYIFYSLSLSHEGILSEMENEMSFVNVSLSFKVYLACSTCWPGNNFTRLA